MTDKEIASYNTRQKNYISPEKIESVDGDDFIKFANKLVLQILENNLFQN